MKIYGFQKITLLDYPEHVAATIFTGGCNFRCPFCHNGELVLGIGNRETAEGRRCDEAISEEEVLAYLEKRRGVLQGVCITGGEPTLVSDLEEFIRKIRDMGYLVKLDTNGYRPEILWSLLEKGLLDYIAMDIKASRENYGRAAGMKNLDLARIEESIAILKSGGIPYEFRTTVVKGIHEAEEFEAIGKWLAGSRAYFLQAFRESENMLGEGFSCFSRSEMKEMAAKAAKYIDKVSLRGVE